MKFRIPKPKSKAGGLIELVVIVALALGLALAIQAWLRHPPPNPRGAVGGDAEGPRRRPARAVESLHLPPARPEDRQHGRLPPARRGRVEQRMWRARQKGAADR